MSNRSPLTEETLAQVAKVWDRVMLSATDNLNGFNSWFRLYFDRVDLAYKQQALKERARLTALYRRTDPETFVLDEYVEDVGLLTRDSNGVLVRFGHEERSL